MIIIIKIILQGLSQVEEMLISSVIPIMSIYRLPHGQYGYKGHVINLPQDITTFATSLPRLPKELDHHLLFFLMSLFGCLAFRGADAAPSLPHDAAAPRQGRGGAE